MSVTVGIAILAAGAAALAVGLLLWLRGRRKSVAERERDRRLAVNLVGRITEGTLLETARSPSDSKDSLLLLYRYSAAGVEYSAAQDISTLRHLVRMERCWPGQQAAVKYDPHNPSNSIIICELWSGLPEDGGKQKPGAGPSNSPREG